MLKHKKGYVSAIILAAGTASRMGKSKQMLPLGERTLLEHVIHRTLSADFAEVLTVIGHEAEAIQKIIAIDDQRFRWIVNGAYRAGQSTSLKLGIENVQDNGSTIMVFLGDLPFISDDTIRLIYQAGVDQLTVSAEPFSIRPIYQGVAGHPVFFGNCTGDLFAALQGDKGAKAMMDKIPNHIRLEVEDSGILFDVDTPEDYTKAKSILVTTYND